MDTWQRRTGLYVLALVGIILGYALAYVLVFVINKRSFGWTLQLSVSPEILLQALALAVAVAHHGVPRHVKTVVVCPRRPDVVLFVGLELLDEFGQPVDD